MEYTWVIARYRSNDSRGKNALDHASIGLGYILVNPDRGKTDDIMVAFKFVLNKQIPHYLTEANDFQKAKFEKKWK